MFSRTKTLTVRLAAGIFLAASPAFSQGWIDVATNVLHSTCNVSFASRWDPENGIHLRISTPDGKQAATVDISAREGRIGVLPAGVYSTAAAEGGQFCLDALPSNSMSSVKLVLKFRLETWGLYMNDRPVAFFPAPFTPPAIVSQMATETPLKADPARMQATGDIEFHDDFMVEEEKDEDAKLAQWDRIRGDWKLHTAGDSAVELEYIKQDARKNIKPAFSANFYSLKGSGTNAIIASGYDFYDAYSVEASIQSKPGEMGLIFYLQDSGTYHAFTIKMEPDSDEARILLWKNTSTNGVTRQYLRAITTTITHGQWIMLRAKTYQNRIECYVDDVKVMDVPAELPAGGRFGLYADGLAGTRFDDFSAKSNHDLDFLSINDIRRTVVAEKGRFFPRKKFFNLFGSSEAVDYLKPEKSDSPQWLMLGSTAHEGHVFSAQFTPERTDKPWNVGLVAGFRETNAPFYRFLYTRTGQNEDFALEMVSTGSVQRLENFSLKARGSEAQARTVTLMCDATDARELRLYRDGEMVLVHPATIDATGASGLYVAPKTAVRISGLSYTFQRQNVYKNRFVTNKAYIEDNFMRHWSSPEGQWLYGTNGLTWHQGDFFGKFLVRLPFVSGSETHVGVEEGETNGAFAVIAATNEIRIVSGSDANARRTLATIPVSTLFAQGETTNTYSVNSEGYWLWISGNRTTVFKTALKSPLKGRKIRLSGFTADQLKQSHVVRYNVLDYLFNESLHDWTINGGQWEVVNRFQCDPRWSHMNGESTNGIAALWNKHLFKGDFCMELYAGMRMGWYERCGDLNMTIMNSRTTASDGYTAICTGWDYDLSQLYSRLFRDGVMLAQSDKYMAPRQRAGNVRKGFVPLIIGGRDVHGGWYYIKLRRIGTKLEYFFDNELVFTTDDPSPIEEGSAGIWTYLNSMMVARVKIAAEEIRPRPIPYSPAFLIDRPPAGDEARLAARYGDVQKDGRPIESMLPPNWEIEDAVGHSRLDWHEEKSSGPYFVTENVLGAGPTFVKCNLPPVPYYSLAGWRFLLKRTREAEFNFHYSVGHLKDNKEYVPEKLFFHRITGPSFSAGRFKMSGETSVPHTAGGKPKWHEGGNWTPVDVWVASQGMREAAKDSNLLVRVEGFGNLQPSFEAEGLTGNAPGDGFAVRDFSEVLLSPPSLTMSTNSQPPQGYSLVEFRTGRKLITTTNLLDVQARINNMAGAGLFRPTLVVQRSDGESRHVLSWIRLPSDPAMTCSWDKQYPGSISLAPDADYPDRRLAFAFMSVGNVLAPLGETSVGKRYAPVPRRFDFCESAATNLPVTIVAGEKIFNFNLPWEQNPLSEPPVMLRVEGITPLFESFERRELAQPLQVDAARMRIGNFDRQQGSYLEVFNTERGQRLRSYFGTAYRISNHPVFQFRYRGTNTAAVSLSLADTYYARLSEEFHVARTVRDTAPLVLDGEWHTWLGFIGDALTERAFDKRFMSAGTIALASYNGVDQTGRYTSWNIDDLVLGPAVSRKEQLSFTPYFFDFGGVADVFMAVRQGRESYPELTKDQQRDIRWVPIQNMSRSTPDIASLEDGFAHIFVKARDKNGEESLVTDLPFYLDRKAMETSYAMEATEDPMANGTLLRVRFSNVASGAPLDLESTKVCWDDKEFSVPALCSVFAHQPGEDTMVLNWPYIFRDNLDKSINGQAYRICFRELKDGAGNPSPDLAIEMKIDYATDKRPPTILPTGYPTNTLWVTPWEVGTDNNLYFAPAENAFQPVLVRETNETPYLSSSVWTNGGMIYHSFDHPPWLVATNPYLSFRMRRPDYLTNDTTRIDMVLETTVPQTNVLSLTHTATGTTAVVLSEPITWQSNVWQSFTFDIPQLLKSKYTPDQINGMQIKFLKFVRSDVTATNTIHLQSFYVYGPINPVESVKMNAYDASGMDKIVAQPEKSEKRAVVPESLHPVEGFTGWTSLRALDRAGNLSAAMWFPPLYTNAPATTIESVEVKTP